MMLTVIPLKVLIRLAVMMKYCYNHMLLMEYSEKIKIFITDFNYFLFLRIHKSSDIHLPGL